MPASRMRSESAQLVAVHACATDGDAAGRALDRKAATARRSAGVSVSPCARITPVSSAATMRSWLSALMTSRAGARATAPCSWHEMQFCA